MSKRGGRSGSLLLVLALAAFPCLWLLLIGGPLLSRVASTPPPPSPLRLLRGVASMGNTHGTHKRNVPSMVMAVSDDARTAALRHIPSSTLHVSKPTWWLESRFHFSFADYYNPDNMDFGVLRVLNDDLVKPKAGFGTHGHRDMEIFSYVLNGHLTHKDSMGNGESLPRGSVQYMSAGRGVTHSEMNNGDDMLRFLQVWIKPDRTGLQPNYGSREYKKEDRHNKIQRVITGVANKAADAVDDGQGIIPINQDVNVYISESDAGTALKFKLNQGRQAYMICAEGSAKVNSDVLLNTRDAVEIRSNGVASDVDIMALDQGAHYMLIEMQESS